MTPAPKRRWLRYSLRTLFVLTGMMALILGLLVAVRQALVGPRGPVEDRAQWPGPLQHLLVQASEAQINVEPVRVYCIHDFIDRYYFWRMDASPELVALMVSEWGLRPGTQSDVDRFWQCWPSHWETPNGHGPQKCLANWGNKSDNFIVMVDGSSAVVHVYYWWNF
jgi:hypothetical protein